LCSVEEEIVHFVDIGEIDDHHSLKKDHIHKDDIDSTIAGLIYAFS
jgi:hypothetical protein